MIKAITLSRSIRDVISPSPARVTINQTLLGALRDWYSIAARLLGVAIVIALGMGSAEASVRSVGGFYGHDSFQHAIVQTSDDALHEFFFDANGVHESDLGCFGGVVSTASFFTDDDNTGHVIIGTSKGDLREVFYSSSIGVHQTPPFANVPGIISLGGFYDANSKLRVVIVATSGGKVLAISYRSNVAPQTQVLGTFPGLVAASGFYSNADKIDHAIVLLADGSISEIFFSKTIGVHLTQPPLMRMPGAVTIASFYSAPDGLGHVIVAKRDGSISEIFYGSSIGVHLSQPPIALIPGTVALGAYYSPADKRAHVIAGTSNGAAREIAYGGPAAATNRLIALTTNGPAAADISPDAPNGSTFSGDGHAGLTISLAGDTSALYAVSLNAGIWKSSNNGSWFRLLNSPRYAYSIAVDPNNPSHLAVGERNGDAKSRTQNGAGLWESFNGGSTWSYMFDPLTLSGCNSQSIPSVAFSKASTLFIATSCGIGRKAAGADKFDFSESPANLGAVRAITTSATKVWARTDTQLLFSVVDGAPVHHGASWTARSFPPNANFLGSENSIFVSEHDHFSLAAFDNAAYFSCCGVKTSQCGTTNVLLVYEAGVDKFVIQPTLLDAKGNSQLGCDGAGLGGSRFVKAFSRSGTPHLFYGSGQEVYEATAFNADGTVQAWTMPLGASCPGCTNQDKVHSDFWDFLESADGNTQWIGNDGGVYQRTLSPSGPWIEHNAGLHTHHAHMLEAVRSGPNVRLAYPTSDNDAWYLNASTGPLGWVSGGYGDMNWSASDEGNASVVFLARLSTGDAMLASFEQNLPNGLKTQGVKLTNGSRDGPEAFNFIQTLESETPSALGLDAIMLADLPLQYLDGGVLKNVAGTLGQPPAAGHATVLLRNKNFVYSGDIDQFKGAGWQIAANNLPPGAAAFWVAGGHANPSFYLLAQQSAGTKLFKAEGQATSTYWQELNVQGNVLQTLPYPASGILTGSQTTGPVFVNPYDPTQLYVLTDQGVRVSTNSGFSFSPDAALTSLITASGKYPLDGNYPGGDGENVRQSTRAAALGTLSDMGFCRYNPKIAVASSPFAGVFFKDENNTWHDLTPLLPQPHGQVSSVRIDCEAVYVTTEGGGSFRITGYRQMP